MIGQPLPSYPLNPWDPQAAAFLATMMTRLGARMGPAEPPADGWAGAYRCRRCPCGGLSRPGNPCVRCGQVAP